MVANTNTNTTPIIFFFCKTYTFLMCFSSPSKYSRYFGLPNPAPAAARSIAALSPTLQQNSKHSSNFCMLAATIFFLSTLYTNPIRSLSPIWPSKVFTSSSTPVTHSCSFSALITLSSPLSARISFEMLKTPAPHPSFPPSNDSSSSLVMLATLKNMMP